MKNTYIFFFTLLYFSVFAQKPVKDSIKDPHFTFSKNILIEDINGKLITNPIAREKYFIKKQQKIDSNLQTTNKSSLNLLPEPLCKNGTFEEFETIGGINYLKNFSYINTEPLNPIQCKAETAIGNLDVKQYDPADANSLASTVPANYLDEYIGNIHGFDQFALKINYKHTDLETMCLVQGKRYKTDNETSVKFNYKAVLQSIEDGSHTDEQPYFKARVVNKSGIVVSEFCIIGDPSNCIFKQAPNLEGGSIILYTENWQSGILDITAIPNNEDFTIEFMAARCGLGGHFGYAFVDDICLLHSNENLQGSIELDPLYKICPTLPISVCGKYTLPNSGGVSATVASVTLKVYDGTNAVVFTSSTPLSLDLVNHKFCFSLVAANLPNVTTGNYNVSVTINYGIIQTDCAGTSFAAATDDDANPGWDISFMNCSPTCAFTLQTGTLQKCDTNHDGKEFFNISTVNTQIAGAQPGLTFAYFTKLADATNNTNPITTFANYETTSTTIFVRVSTSATCFKIIAINLLVKNPTATISGILNICGGSTVLTASSGTSYLWSTGGTTQNITVTAVGTYTVNVTDIGGCVATGTVTIIPNTVAVQPTILVTQPTCSVATGSISITSPASEYSYDGGTTWSTNSIMTNLPLGNYIVKIKTASGCISYNTSIDIVPFLSSFPDFTAVSPTSCSGLGSITITSVAPFYSFDDGLTFTTNNVATDLPGGTYLIRTKDAAGCLSNFNSVVLNSEFLDPPLFTTVDPYCSNLGSITITTLASEYSFDGGTTWQASNTLLNLVADSYIIKIRNADGCTSPNVYVYLQDLEYSYPNFIQTDATCGTYASILITTSGDEYSFDGGTTWTTDPFLTNLTSYTSYNIVVKRLPNCISYTNSVYINNAYLPIPPANDFSVTLCDNLNDGSENIDLPIYNSDIIVNPTDYNFTYFNSLLAAENNDFANQISNPALCNLSNTNNKVYVRVTSTDNCYKISELSFTFIESPIIELDELVPLCKNRNIRVDAGGGFTTYLWSTGETTQTILIDQIGTYSVTVTKDHNPLICSSTRVFNVFISDYATITEIETQDWTVNNNVITVQANGVGVYEYSIDGINYQDGNVFSELACGVYTVYVRDKNGCGVVKDEVSLLMYPKFFTPNGDGDNDTWGIKFSKDEPGLKVELFDRYGKLIKEFRYNESWDGRYNGAELPSTDYWFVVTRIDGKQHRGHFTLKR
ncbi:MAG: T9SS type B sorting domain-containing protein [Bacteroidota bacterium]